QPVGLIRRSVPQSLAGVINFAEEPSSLTQICSRGWHDGVSIPLAHSGGRAVDCVRGRCAVADTEEVLASMLPRLTAADTALHNGDAGPRKAPWSTTDPVTLFGAAVTTIGWPQIEATFDWLASRFSDCASFEIDVVAAGASGDLAYLVAFEHTTAS